MKHRPIAAMAEAIGFAERLSAEIIGTTRVRFTAAFSDGEALYAVRYSTDAFAPTLYAGPMGSKGGHCLVSEPLNDDTETWVEIPPGSAVILNDAGLNVMGFEPEIGNAPARVTEMAG